MSTYDSNGFEFYNDLVFATAVRLIKSHGATTTLEIKEELRVRHEFIEFDNVSLKPTFTQQQVSDSMDWLARNSYFSYTFNGQHRTYYLNTREFSDKTKVSDVEDVYVNINDGLGIINDLIKGDKLIITFIKKDDNKRTINAEIYTSNRGDGYLCVIDLDLPDGEDGNNIRTIDLRRLISFEYNEINYIIDKSK